MEHIIAPTELPVLNRLSRLTGRPTVSIINPALLDMSAETFDKKMNTLNISDTQMSLFTDTSRMRILRIRNGVKTSLVKRDTGMYTVPRLYVVALMAIEAGMLTTRAE